MMKENNIYHAIGIMSGSSLDGLDVALCSFSRQSEKWQHEIIAAECFPLADDLKSSLRHANELSGKELWQLHVSFGKFIGRRVDDFLGQLSFKKKIDCIASHGYTVFHFPESGFTTQVGDGASIAATTGITTVCDLRALDVALGGTGAPIVPVADKLLFSDYEFCLNLGGIANVSAKTDNQIIAFDVCPCNQLLDFLASKCGLEFDDEGKLAAQGKVDETILFHLLQLPFHQSSFPKSLDNSFSKYIALPLIESMDRDLKDKLRTSIAYIATQIEKDIRLVAMRNNIALSQSKLLATGGGAFNKFLISELQKLLPLQVVIPDKQVVQFKEALAMALMGILRLHNQVNVFSSVTNASCDSVNGAVYAGNLSLEKH